MMFKLGYKFLFKKFKQHGKTVAKHTSWFVVIPLFLTAFLATGVQKFQFDNNESVFVTSGGVVGKHKSRLTHLFPMDVSSTFDPTRSLEMMSYGSVIIEARDNGSVLRNSIFQEIVLLDKHIRNLTINEENSWSYQDMCAKIDGKCFQNKVLLLKRKIRQIENGKYVLKYPLDDTSQDFNVLALGGVELNKTGYIISARALRLVYFLNDKGVWKKTAARKWEKLFLHEVDNQKFFNIKIAKDASISKEVSRNELIPEAMKYFPYSLLSMFLFTFFTCLSPDFLRSKPWTGIMTIFATGMSLASGFGLLLSFGIYPTAIVIMVPFLVLGIGMDDTFVMLSVWMKTYTKKTLEERLAETFSESGMSITLTSFTNIVSFAVGIFSTNLPLHQNFCLYMAICLFFDYIYQITFVAAVLALCGRAEEGRLHSMVFVSLEACPSSNDKCFLRNILCYVQRNDLSSEEKKQKFSIQNFWLKLGNLLTKKLVKLMVMMIYFLYLGCAIWGFTKLSFETSFDLHLVNGTNRYIYYQLNKEYFHQYQYRLQLFINEEMNYADPRVQQQIEEILQNLESDPLIAGSLLTESWLRSYLKVISDRRMNYFLSGYNFTNSEDFLTVLSNMFLRHPQAKRFKRDIAFNQNFTKIVSSRFLLQTNITRDANHFYELYVKFRNKVDAAPCSLILYHPLFYYFDVVDEIPVTATQTSSIALVTVFILSFLLLPNIISIISVLLCVTSVIVGIVGYVSLCNISIGIITITIFIMLIGLSVDYAAHISCAYTLAKEEDKNSRLVKAVSVTGMPILQGSITTILAIVTIINIPVLELHDVIKFIILACVIATIHGIIFFPVIMSLLDFSRPSMCKKQFGRNAFDLQNFKEETVAHNAINISVNKLEEH